MYIESIHTSGLFETWWIVPSAQRGARFSRYSSIRSEAARRPGSPRCSAARSTGSPFAAMSVTLSGSPKFARRPSALCRSAASRAKSTTMSMSPRSRKAWAATPCSHAARCIESIARATRSVRERGVPAAAPGARPVATVPPARPPRNARRLLALMLPPQSFRGS